MLSFLFLKIFYLFLEREKEGERSINVWLPLTHPQLGAWPTTQARALTGNRTSDPLVRWLALSPLSRTSQGRHMLSLKIQIYRKCKVKSESPFTLPSSPTFYCSKIWKPLARCGYLN